MSSANFLLMRERFLSLSLSDRRDAIGVASEAIGRPAHILEKDVWVVWCLESLFAGPDCDHLVFKGGTSLSKVYRVIDRFSEDVDVTYDIRKIIPDLTQEGVIPRSRSQAGKWTKEVHKRLPGWIDSNVLPMLRDQLRDAGLGAEVVRDGNHIVRVTYEPSCADYDYVSPSVQLEFGARSTGQPAEAHSITCDIASELLQLDFPTAKVTVMKAERTFWEKATAAHVFCLKGDFRGADRWSRHWYDLLALDRAGVSDIAFGEVDVATDVAAHKSMFFREKAADGEWVDFNVPISGGLRLVPEGEARDALKEDWEKMGELLSADPEPFTSLMNKCSDLEARVNDAMRKK